MLGGANPYTLSGLRGEGEGSRGLWRWTRAWALRLLLVIQLSKNVESRTACRSNGVVAVRGA